MTAEQMQARLDAYLGELWHRCGGFYVRQDDYQIPGEIRMACEAIAIARYGKRRAAK